LRFDIGSQALEVSDDGHHFFVFHALVFDALFFQTVGDSFCLSAGLGDCFVFKVFRIRGAQFAQRGDFGR
jgi:hypothetical protein